MHRSRLLAACSAIAIAFLCWGNSYASATTPTSASAGETRLSGNVLPALSRASRLTQQNPSSTLINVTFVLRRDDQKGFESFLHSLYDPKSPNYHRFLTQEQIADRFGPSRADYESLFLWLEARGFTPVEGSTNRLTITVRGTREMAERALRVKIADYKLAKRQFYANDRNPALPRRIASIVQAVEGLSDLAAPRPAVLGIFPNPKSTPQPSATASPLPTPKPPPQNCSVEQSSMCGYNAGQVGLNGCESTLAAQKCYQQCLSAGGTPSQYNGSDWGQVLAQFVAEDCTPPIHQQAASRQVPSAQSIDGSGQTVGLVEFDSFVQGDVSNYIGLLGLPPDLINNVSKVDVNGGVSPGPGQDEVLLDIGAILTVAPGAKVVVYDAPFSGPGTSFQQVFNRMINDGVTVISNSWAYCEDQTSAADVDSIDSILQNAAAAGITVFSGSGDTGSTCLDGSPNTISVPADSPNLTAVGGTSLTTGPGGVYQSETWWNGANATPPTGQGGFGVSKFFSAPSYQSGLSGSSMRSIPDVSINADPSTTDDVICEATAGGCPNGLLYGGTSVAAPVWAGIMADINQSAGKNLGALNPLIYPLAGSAAFNGPTAMVPASDFAHVGLGSPNLDALDLALTNQTVGTPSATNSLVNPEPLGAAVPAFGTANGTSEVPVVVTLIDSNGHLVSGKTVTLSANSPTSAQITPGSAVTGPGGEAVFEVTDSTPETVQFTAQDTSDGVTLTPALNPSVIFQTPPATSVGLAESGSPVTANGVATGTITITMEDSKGNPTAGKLVQLSQGTGNSVISGPNPPVTDSNGQIAYTVSDTNNETVTYSATDVTDGNLPFPQTAQITFSNSPNSGCAAGTPTVAPGYVVTAIATGFKTGSIFAGDINFGPCFGASPPAFDSSGNIYVSDFLDGYLYKFPSTGGLADASTQLADIGVTLAQPVFVNGNLWVVRATTGSGITPAGFYEVDPSNGTILKSFTGLFCSLYLAGDPISGGVFSGNACNPGDARLWYSDLTGASPTFSVYATLPDVAPGPFSVASDGTIFSVGGFIVKDPYFVSVSPTDVSPTTVTTFAGVNPIGGVATVPTTGATSSVILDQTGGTGPIGQTTLADVTTNPATTVQTLTVNSAVGFSPVVGPDGCLYGVSGDALFKVTRSDGTCPFASTTQTATLSLSPPIASPNPAQGSTQMLIASLHFAAPTAGTPVTFKVTGANPFNGSAAMDASGNATFTYVGRFPGVDTINASTTVGGKTVSSNPAIVTWGPGLDTTFLTLNGSPTSVTQGQSVTLVASLTDSSQAPATPIAGQTIDFALGNQTCNGTTNSSGIATCSVTPSTLGIETLAANFAGTGQYVGSTASTAFNVAQPTVTGKLKIHPKRLNFGTVAVGSSKTKNVKIINKGKITKKKTASPIIINSQSATPGVFQVTNGCSTTLDPKAKHQKPGRCTVSVTFKPTSAGKFTGTLTILDNLEPNLYQTVEMVGKGK